jgi:hypothetical protein
MLISTPGAEWAQIGFGVEVVAVDSPQDDLGLVMSEIVILPNPEFAFPANLQC